MVHYFSHFADDGDRDRDRILDGSVNLQTQNIGRQEIVFDNASILIEINPSLWTELPDSATKLLESLVVERN